MPLYLLVVNILLSQKIANNVQNNVSRYYFLDHEKIRNSRCVKMTDCFKAELRKFCFCVY